MLNRMSPVKKVINTIIDVHPGTVIFKIKCSIKDLARYNKLTPQRKIDSSEITIGMIPIGTGNDWCRTYEYSKWEEFIEAYPDNMKRIVSDSAVVYYGVDFSLKRYYLNVAGIGFDADVASKVDADKMRNKSGTLTYLKNLFVSLINSKIVNYKIKIDDEEIHAGIFSMAIGIGKYNGGGMMQLPKAKPDDGILDITLIKNISKIDVLKEVKNLYDGSFIKHKEVSLHTGSKVEIFSNQKVRCETDGEVICKTPLKIEILPSSLNVLIPKSADSF